jgi:MFS family permease
VDDERVQSAIRLTATARWLGLLAGPALGGVVMLVFGPAWGILLNALIYVPFIVWLWKSPYKRQAVRPVRATRGFADLAATVRQIAGNPVIVSMTLLAGCASLIVGNAYQAQMPEFAHDFGHTEGGITYSALLAADAAGALTAGLLLESRGLLTASPRTAFVLAMLWCVSMASFALTTYYPLALALLFVAGFFELSLNAMAQTLVQLHAPAPLRGRVIGLFAMSSLGLRAFSGLTVGLGGAWIGIHLSLALSAGVLFAITLALLAFTIPHSPSPDAKE